MSIVTIFVTAPLPNVRSVVNGVYSPPAGEMKCYTKLLAIH